MRVRRGVGHRVTRPELVGGHGQGSNVPAAPVEDGPWVEQVEVDPRVERVRLVRSRARARARAGLGLGLGLGLRPHPPRLRLGGLHRRLQLHDLTPRPPRLLL